MDSDTPQPKSEKQQSSSLIAALQILDRLENWLTSLFELTDEELENAGVYLRDHPHE